MSLNSITMPIEPDITTNAKNENKNDQTGSKLQLQDTTKNENSEMHQELITVKMELDIDNTYNPYNGVIKEEDNPDINESCTSNEDSLECVIKTEEVHIEYDAQNAASSLLCAERLQPDLLLDDDDSVDPNVAALGSLLEERRRKISKEKLEKEAEIRRQRQQKYYERHREEINRRKRDRRRLLGPEAPEAIRDRIYRERNRDRINELRRVHRERLRNEMMEERAGYIRELDRIIGI